MKMLYELMLLGGLIAVARAGDPDSEVCCANCVEAFWNNFHFVPTSDPGVCTQADVCFVVDCSGSIGAAAFELLKQFIQNIISSPNLPIGQNEVRIGLVKFADTSAVRFLLDYSFDEQALLTRVGDIPFGGGFTNTMAGIHDCRVNVFTQSGDRPGVPDVMIVLTDGNSNRGTDPGAEADLARGDGIQVLAVGIGNNVDQQELEDIAGGPDNVIRATDFADLANIIQQVAEATCMILEPPKEPKEDGPSVCTVPSNPSILCTCNRGPHICEVPTADPTDIDCFTS